MLVPCHPILTQNCHSCHCCSHTDSWPFAVTSAMATLPCPHPQQAVPLHAPSCSVDPELIICSLPSLGGEELTSPCSRDVVRLSFPWQGKQGWKSQSKSTGILSPLSSFQAICFLPSLPDLAILWGKGPPSKKTANMGWRKGA